MFDRETVRREVDSGGTGREGHVGAIVDEAVHPRFPGPDGEFAEFAAARLAVAKMQYGGVQRGEPGQQVVQVAAAKHGTLGDAMESRDLRPENRCPALAPRPWNH